MTGKRTRNRDAKRRQRIAAIPKDPFSAEYDAYLRETLSGTPFVPMTQINGIWMNRRQADLYRRLREGGAVE